MNHQQKHEKLNINSISLAEFEAAGIPQITKKRAESIIKEREINGPFESIESLALRVAGIGPAFLRQLKSYFVVSPTA